VSSPSYEGGDHLTDVQIATYLDRTLTAPQRDLVEDHLAICPECRQHVLETRELLERMRRPRKFLIGGTLAAAAAVVFLVARPEPDPIDQRKLMRSDGTPTSLVAYGPISTAARVGLRFVWSAAPGAESYRLTVSRADAQPVWSSSGTDTVARLPDSVVLRSGERYFWVADALLSDGTTRSTGLREFGIDR
jgi:anti-sigma factor RsiW